MKKLILLTLIASATFQAKACELFTPEQVNVAISTEYKTYMFYDALKVLKEAPYSTIRNCKMTAAKRRYVMISLGIENLMYSNEASTFSISDKLKDRSCKIANSALRGEYGHAKIQDELNRKRTFLNKCSKVLVTDFSNKGIQYPEEQTGCTVERVSKSSVSFSGKYCYFRPSFDSTYSVQVDLNNECATEAGLKKANLTLKDFNASLDFFTSDVATGKNNDLSSLGSALVRYSVNPVNSIVKKADDFGIMRPVFPAKWTVSDIHPANIEISNRGKYNKIKVPLVVDTQCKRTCDNGMCSSPCDYAQPIVGEHILESYENGKWEFLSSWYDGSVVPGQWRGISHGLGYQLPKGNLEAGKRYRIRIVFKEPNLDYGYFNGDIQQAIRLVSNNLGSIGRTGRINKIPLLDVIHVNSKLPKIEVIANLNFNGELDGVKRSLRTLHSYLDNKFWPPLYEELCQTPGSCVDNGSDILELGVEFTLVAPESRRGAFRVKDVNFSKNSIFGNNYVKKNVVDFPEVKCEL